ncbi:hypothetical protein RB195_000450 [Necator americanus]|uniref:Uncharacterized protein n=1 Tax=Necator americanus TaxID=51031 RepID=A0ABR1DAN0_NECAM
MREERIVGSKLNDVRLNFDRNTSLYAVPLTCPETVSLHGDFAAIAPVGYWFETALVPAKSFIRLIEVNAISAHSKRID